LQQNISHAKQQEFVGRTLDVLIEGVGELESHSRKSSIEERVSIGRSYRDAPEVDGVVIVRAELPAGKFARVKITQALEYDLIGVPA
jgi:ribosomal protein S12 methylthiotransferase